MRTGALLSPLHHPGFRLLVAGQLSSNVGDAFYAVALPWYVLSGGAGPLLLGTVLAAYGIPRTALLFFGGHASDRWGPWTVMLAVDGMRAVGVAVLAAAAAGGPPDPALLLPVAAVLGAGEGLFLPGSFSIVPSLVPDHDLQPANALAQGGTQLSLMLGPALGGIVIASLGPAPAFAVDAASFLISAATLVGVRASHLRAIGASPAGGLSEPATTQGLAGAEVPAGPSLLTMLRSERILQIMLLVTLAANLGSGGFSAVALPDLAHGPFHAGAAGYGALLACLGGGALFGTVAAGQMGRLRRPALLATAAFGAESLAMGLAPYLGGVVEAGAALAALGVLNGLGNLITITAFQRWAPPDLLGRLMGLLMLSSMGVFPVSVVLAGWVCRSLGPAPFFPLAGAALGLAVLAALSQSSWRSFGADAPPPDPALGQGEPGSC